MKLNLKRCPFCGAAAYAQKWPTGPHDVSIACSNNELVAGAGGCPGSPISHGKTAKKAAARWNTRAADIIDPVEVVL